MNILHFISGQVECNAPFGIVTILDISDETDEHVQEHYDAHSAVEHPEVPSEVVRILHVVFQGYDLHRK